MPADGLVYLCPSIDTVGWLTQDAAGAALAASVVCPDWNAASARTLESLPVVGVPESGLLTCVTDEARQAFEMQLVRLAESGVEVRRVRFLPDEDVVTALRLAGSLLNGEMAAVHAAWFDRHADLYRPRTAAAILKGRTVSAGEIEIARARQLSLRLIEQVMDTAGVDVLALPSSNGPAPEGLEVTGWADMTGLWSYAGLPCVSLPAGFARNGLPLGLQLVAPFGADERLVAWATSLQPVLPSVPQELAVSALTRHADQQT